ncbi:MAG: GTPase Era, partial [Methylococcales bacterium]|nr:GTPase Era [Methylococcales bacterium]
MKVGYVALVGRPNVGKSTLMNHLLGQKISITSRKPQTTRHRILGINTCEKGQAIYMDTPGMHQNEKKALNRYLNQTADNTLFGVDVVVWLIDGLAWQPYDDVIFKKLKLANLPVILVVNKVDRVQNKEDIFKFLD